MRIGIPKEITSNETRVAVVPSLVSGLIRQQHEVMVERGAGISSSFDDEQYVQAGARIADDARSLYQQADIVFKVQPPGTEEAELLRESSTYMGFLAPLARMDIVKRFTTRRITSFSMEYVPRITRAQTMDALSSMSTIAGYKAVLLAASHIGKIFPLMMTAAGTIPPTTVLVLGAGVAGLQAIATAKRLGAKVEAFDPRPAVREQVKSLGATFIEMEMPEDVETAGGYAKELSPEFLRKEQEAIGARFPKVDVVISTAQVFGKRAPILITADMVKLLRRDSVILDLAAEQGGNCELTEAGKTVVKNAVAIIGAVNLPATVPVHASQMYAKNITNLFSHIYPKGSSTPNFEDEITKGSCITHNGEIVNEHIKKAIQQEGIK